MKIQEITEGKNDPHTHKAVFMLGGPGSGKSYVAKKLAGGTGLRRVDIDQFYEMIQARDQISGDYSDELYQYARTLRDKRMALFVHGRLGLLIDGTGRWIPSILKTKQRLEQLGYDTMAVFVNTDIKTALNRVEQRMRKTPRDVVVDFHKQVRNNLGELQSIFPGDRLLIVDNHEGADDFTRAQKVVDEFLNAPTRKPKTWPQEPVNEQYSPWVQQFLKLDLDGLSRGAVRKKFKNELGMKLLGNGLFADVFGTKTGKFVVKVTSGSDPSYQHYARRAQANLSNPHLPRVPYMRYYKDHKGDQSIIAIIEKLQGVTGEYDVNKLAADPDYAPQVAALAASPYRYDLGIKLNEFTKSQLEQARNHRLYKTIQQLDEVYGGDLDLHDGNIMVNPQTKTIVITDPVAFWEPNS